MPRGLGKTQKKILVLLLGGVTFGLAQNPKKQWTVLKEIPFVLQDIEQHNSLRSAFKLRERGLIRFRKTPDGFSEPVLTKKGRKEATRYALENFQVPPATKWDGKWRIVVFDIPETQRHKRDTIRHHLKKIGFHEVQRSVFLFPFPCREMIDQIVNFLEAQNYVRYGELVNFDDRDVRELFHLPTV